MTDRRWLLAGFLLAVAATAYTAFAPLYDSASKSSDGVATTGTASLVEVNGWGGLIPGLLLTALAFGVWRARVGPVRWVMLGMFLILVLAGLLSLGLFYVPAAICLVVGSLLAKDPEPDLPTA